MAGLTLTIGVGKTVLVVPFYIYADDQTESAKTFHFVFSNNTVSFTQDFVVFTIEEDD